MAPSTTSPADFERAYARAEQLRAELARKERAVGRRIQSLAKGLASLMEPGEHSHRIGVGIHAFEVEGAMCLAASYLDEVGDGYRYHYAVLCGGEKARVALRTAALHPSDSDEPGPQRRVAMATYDEYEDFLARLPKYMGDVTRKFEDGLARADGAVAKVEAGRKLLTKARRAKARASQQRQRRQPEANGH